jgi:hypothetical protein
MTASLKEQITEVKRARMTRRHQAQFDDGLSLGANKAADALSDAVATLESAADLRRTFDLRWDADQRAIKLWQDAHPGNDVVWPDRCDMVVWLLDQLDAARKP